MTIRAIQFLVLTVSALSVLATAYSLNDSVARLRRYRRRGINGSNAVEAKHRIAREVRRLFKHSLAVAGIALWSFSDSPFDPVTVARTVLFALICAEIAETSLSDQRHAKRIERMVEPH